MRIIDAQIKIEKIYMKNIELERNVNQISEREIACRTHQANILAKNIPINNNYKETLIIKLFSKELDKCDLNDIHELTQLIKSTKALDSNEVGSHRNDPLKCLKCKRIFNGKAQHTKHLNRSENSECRIFYDRKKFY